MNVRQHYWGYCQCVHFCGAAFCTPARRRESVVSTHGVLQLRSDRLFRGSWDLPCAAGRRYRVPVAETQPTARITYRGPPALVGALAHSLREEGVAVQPYAVPDERRHMGDVTHEVVIELVVTGTAAAVGVATAKFRKWFPEPKRQVSPSSTSTTASVGTSGTP